MKAVPPPMPGTPPAAREVKFRTGDGLALANLPDEPQHRYLARAAAGASMISSRRSIACGFSILASSAALSPISALPSMTSSGRWTKDKAM